MKNKILKIDSLNLSYNTNNKQMKVLENINFELYENEIISIIGESGAGKTTLVKYIMQLDNDKTIFSVKEYMLNGRRIDLNYNKMKEMYGNTISLVLQDPVTSLNPILKIGIQFEIIIKEKYPNISKKEIKNRIEEIFKEINIDNFKDVLRKYPSEISGGMNQRINIALSLIKEPKILILDEPTSAIDASNRINLIELIKKIQTKRMISVIFITHDILLAEKISDRIIVMKKGYIIEESIRIGNKFNFISPYSKQLYNSIKLKNKEENINNHEILINFENVNKYFGNNRVLNNFNFYLKAGESLGIMGKSGSGKTTICKLIMGIYKPNEGNIKIKDNIKIEMVYQNANMSINPYQKIYKVLNEQNYIEKRKEYNKEEIYNLLQEFNLPMDVLDRNIYELSGGQRQFISIIRALLNKPDIIILDEPTSSMDVSSQKRVLDLLKYIKNKYAITYIIISHDVEVINYMCNRYNIIS